LVKYTSPYKKEKESKLMFSTDCLVLPYIGKKERVDFLLPPSLADFSIVRGGDG
jgi:hypothetical protein